MLVAGGGSGGKDAIPGGGGAGGLLTATGHSLAKGTYPIVVGAGGVGGGSYNNGENTTAFSLTAVGGGYGGSGSGTANGAAGGSGGGMHGYSAGAGGAATAGQGNAGGAGASGSNSYGAGGGGGAGAVGANATSPHGGNGGAGASNSLRTGSAVTYAGGGGGTAWTGTNGSGGSDGGGAGTSTVGTDGTANTGGGGGGGKDGGGGNGGSGIAVVRWVAGAFGPEYNNMTLVSTATTAESQPTKADIVMTYTNGAGTATVNTDLKAYASRDNGSTYTQVTLTSQGTTGGHTILTAHDVDISSQPSGTAMRYKITTHNQAVGKQTRIHAVSLGWS